MRACTEDFPGRNPKPGASSLLDRWRVESALWSFLAAGDALATLAAVPDECLVPCPRIACAECADALVPSCLVRDSAAFTRSHPRIFL